MQFRDSWVLYQSSVGDPFTAFSGTGYTEVNQVGELNVYYLLLYEGGLAFLVKCSEIQFDRTFVADRGSRILQPRKVEG